MQCHYCEGEPEAGWIEMPNNGPIASCPACNPDGEKERAWNMAERQRDAQRAVNQIDDRIKRNRAGQELVWAMNAKQGY